MVIELIAVAGVSAAVYEYFTNKKFKATVLSDVTVVKNELATLKTKALSVVQTAEADFSKVEAAFKSLLAKL